MIRQMTQGAAVPKTAVPQWACRLLLIVALLGLFGGPVAPVAAAPTATPAFPAYVYVITSGAFSFDVMRNVGGKENRLSRVFTAGVGLSDVAARIAADGWHVAVRVNGDKAEGSSLRVVDVQSSRSITVTLSRSADVGIGNFAWSPDSKSLAYTVATPQRADADTGAGALWVVGADARGARRLPGTGNARLIAWSPDGSGLYYARQDGDPAAAPDLWFLPLDGQPVSVLRSGSADVQWSRFAISPAIMAGAPRGAARAAGLAAGNLGAFAAASQPAAVPHSRPAARTATAEAPGVMVGDSLTGYVPLLDAGEIYSVMAWDPAGSHVLLSGGKTNTAWYVDATTGQPLRLPAVVNKLAPVAWSDDSRYLVLADAGGPATSLVTLDTSNASVVRTRYPGSAGKAGNAVKNLPVPYVSQLWDTGVSFNGNWACGPTSVAMVLAYYGRLTPWPFDSGQARTSAQDRLRTNTAGAEPGKLDLMDGHLYGRYVTTAFTYNGRTFTAAGADASGHRVQGLYGTIVGNTALANWDSMIDVLGVYNISTAYVPASWYGVTSMIDKGFPVILGTTLTASGHIIVASGYTANGYLIVNDPYGNRFEGYGGDNGGNAAYAWKNLPAKLALVARGTITPPAPPPTPTPPATATATPSPALSPVQLSPRGVGGP